MKIRNLLLIILATILCLSLIACGGTCEHNDADGNGVCDKCGDEVAVTPPTECTEHKDENGDGKCDECGKTTGAPAGDGTVALVTDGKANFKIVVGSDATSRRSDIEKLIKKLNDRLDGEDLVYTEESDSTEQAVEILIGTVSSRGDEYALDKYDYGEKGYGIEIVGTKLVVIGGSDSGLKDAINALEEDVFGIVNKVTPITALTLNESIHKPQDDYKIESVTIGGTDLNDFVFAVDESAEANSLATKYQLLFYKNIGDYLEIVPLSSLADGQKAIKIEIIENGGDRTTDEGFNLYVSDGNMIIECEFPNKLEDTLGGFFDREIINTSKNNVEFASDYTYRPNIRIITYEQFGAAGNGQTDDFAAIKAAHDYANRYGHIVHATSNRTYYIGNSTEGKSAIIKTDTYWNGAKFIFDDSQTLVHKTCGCNDCAVRVAPIFRVDPDISGVNVVDAIRANLPLISYFDDGEGTQKFENWPLDYDTIVHMGSSERKVFIRVGANADSGDEISEIIYVHADGTIDPSTPITWNYSKISWATAYSATDTPIVIDGGGAIIETIANRPENNDYISFSRNITVYRSNVTVCNFEHTVQEEQEFRAPYAGIIYVSRCHNITFENIVLQAARRKFVAAGNQQGTYEIGGYAANDIKYINVNVSNFFATGAAHDYQSYGTLHTEGQVGNRGMMGTNYCRNFHFKDCRIVNFDSHKGMGNLTMENCELQSILVMGAGNIVIKDTVIYVDSSKSVVQYRSDYGASFRGNITLENIEIKYTEEYQLGNPNTRICLVKTYYDPSNDYDSVYNPDTNKQEPGEGSTNYMLTNLYVKGIKMTKYSMVKYIEKNADGFNDIEEKIETANDQLLVFDRNVSTGFATMDISKFKSDGGYSDLNRYIPPETIVIEDSYENIILPKSITFKDTKATVDGKEVDLTK